MKPCKLFRIGVFFDGTGNNKENDKAGKSGNGLSNVAKLSDLYPDEKELPGNGVEICAIFTQMVYIEGVGTRNPEKVVKRGKRTGHQYAPGAHGIVYTYEWKEVDEHQDNYKTGLGMGSGGAERINRAIDEVKKAFNAKPEQEYQRIVDVFGFSRGAALARDFINTMNKKFKRKEKYQFGFTGLFDTVGSFGSAGDDINFKPKDPSEYSEAHPDYLAYEYGISAPNSPSRKNFERNFEEYNFHLHMKSAQKIIHLIALNEYRKNFPLTNTRAAGWEYGLLGVHSDIGGGYPSKTSEYASFEPPESTYYYATFYYSALKKARTHAERQQSELSDGWACSAKAGVLSNFYVHCEKTRIVTDDLQKVGLAVMHYQAEIADVPFQEIIEADLTVPDDLQPYWSQATQSPGTAKDYVGKEEVLSQYAHHSSVDTEEVSHHRDSKGFAETALGSNDMQYKDESPHRTVFDNIPGKAVLNAD